jgi:hypothetical protein
MTSPFFRLRRAGVAEARHLRLGHRVDEVLEVLPLLQLLLGDEVVELRQHHGDGVLHVRQPRELLARAPRVPL